MRIFCDTSILVAASLQVHPQHPAAKAVLDRAARSEDIGFISAHSLAETFSVLSRMPTQPKLSPRDALAILETNIIPHFTLILLDGAEYVSAIRSLAGQGLGGGRIYDLLHLSAARKQPVDKIYTFNELEWKQLAPDLEQLIALPPTVATT